MSAKYAGFDYGNGTTNINRETGIRNGVIPSGDLVQSWYDNSEANYGDACCPKCGNAPVVVENQEEEEDEDADKRDSYEGTGEYACDGCKYCFDSDEAFPDSPLSFYYEKDGYSAECGEDGDIFVMKSPYFTYAQFCSPCAPGACHLRNPLEERVENNRCYCFGHDWFEDGKAPYKVFSVETGNEIVPRNVDVKCGNCDGTGRDTLERIAKVREVSVADVDVGQLQVDGYDADKGTFNCFRCHGKGTLPEIIYEEV